MKTRLAAGCVALVLIGVAASSPRPSAPRGREATPLLMAQSLWQDHDLRFEAPDQERGFRIWEEGPGGLELRRDTAGGWRYAAAALLPVLALPLVPVFGPAATAVVTTLALCSLLLAAWRRREDPRSRLLSVGAVAGGALLPWALRGEPIVLVAAAAGWAASILARRPPARRRARGAVIALALLALVVGPQLASWAGEPRTFSGRFPFDAVPGEGAPRPALRLEWSGITSLGLLAGRGAGLLVTAPFFLLAVASSFERRRWIVPVALGLLGVVEIVSPADSARWAIVALTPAWLWLVRRPPGRAGLLLAAAVLGFVAWPVQAAREAMRPEPWVARWLPLEVGRLHADPGYQAVGRSEVLWLVPRSSAFPEERNPRGVWLRGAARSEWLLVSPEPVERVALTVVSLTSILLRLESGGTTTTVRFDSEDKRAGTPLAIPLGGPSRRGAGRFLPGHREYLYRVVFETDGGAVPRRLQRRSPDERYLGAFVGLPD